jgi:hypothetical protein
MAAQAQERAGLVTGVMRSHRQGAGCVVQGERCVPTQAVIPRRDSSTPPRSESHHSGDRKRVEGRLSFCTVA